MEKEQEQTQEQLEPQAGNQQQHENQQHATEEKPLDTLLKEGKLTLTAKSREEIYAKSKELVDSMPEGTKWTRPAVEYDPETGIFSQKYTIIKK